MAKGGSDWFFLGLIVLGGLIAGYILEKHFHILQNLIQDLIGVTPLAAPPVLASQPPVVRIPAPEEKRMYPNPLYDPSTAWDSLDDSWYYMY